MNGPEVDNCQTTCVPSPLEMWLFKRHSNGWPAETEVRRREKMTRRLFIGVRWKLGALDRKACWNWSLLALDLCYKTCSWMELTRRRGRALSKEWWIESGGWTIYTRSTSPPTMRGFSPPQIRHHRLLSISWQPAARVVTRNCLVPNHLLCDAASICTR